MQRWPTTRNTLLVKLAGAEFESASRELEELELSLEAARKRLEIRQLQRSSIIERRFQELTEQNDTAIGR